MMKFWTFLFAQQYELECTLCWNYAFGASLEGREGSLLGEAAQLLVFSFLSIIELLN